MSPLIYYIQNKIGHTSYYLDLSSKHFQDQDKKSTLVPLLASNPAENKNKKKKRTRKRFDASDGP